MFDCSGFLFVGIYIQYQVSLCLDWSMNKYYYLPNLPYDKNGLDPVISPEQLTIHYKKHHAKYVDQSNELSEKLSESPQDPKEISSKLAFNLGGHILHSLFWENLMPTNLDQDFDSNGILAKQFENKEKIIDQIKSIGNSIEGSGWVALFYDCMSDRCLFGNIGNHNLNIYPTLNIILVIDVWEHAYYLDYQNNRAEYLEKICTMINWTEVEKRLLYQKTLKQVMST